MLVSGGWGYNNLGDEAILAGYLEYLRPRAEVVVASVNPTRTAAAQRLETRVVVEGSPAHEAGKTMLLAGGGYLNGTWRPEIYLKLTRLVRMRRSRSLVVHGVEVRRLDSAVVALLGRRFFRDAYIGVRDAKSRAEVAQLTTSEVSIVPDGISLLSAGIDSYRHHLADFEGKYLLNLLDIEGRGDSDEAEVDLANWRGTCRAVIDSLGRRAVGLIIGDGDYGFQREFPDLPLFMPRTVSDLVSAIDSSAGVFSTRMHPALLASMVGTPVVSIPYCGKVRPTLDHIGIGDIIAESLAVDEIIDRLASDVDHSEIWSQACTANVDWLDQAFARAAQV
jgi:polysaccharide pyruvyl transferase WcaK-like protein